MKHGSNTLGAVAVVLVCGLSLGVPASTGLASDQSGQDQSGPDQSGPARPAPGSPAVRVAPSLNLLRGDTERIAAADPIAFEQVPGEREFSGELIVRPHAGRAADGAHRVANLVTQRSVAVEEYVVRVPAGVSEGELAGVLMATGDYEYALPNWTLFPLATTPNDPQFNQSWQHTRLQSAMAWDITVGSPDVIVAVCDSGVRTDHDDLAASLVPGYNSATRRAEVDGGLVEDINGHGTFVAGCAAARGNNGAGVTGVGWNFGIMPIRVTNNTDGTASLFAITDGARWAAANGAKVVNVSFTGGASPGNETVARDIKRLGGLLFWASGNSNVRVPGKQPNLIIVGSTTSSDSRSSFSNYGPSLDITAPGSSVRSTRSNGGYGNGSGTSYASPIAAGVGAMIFAANPDLRPDDVQDILFRSVDDLGAPGYDEQFGWGRVNTFNAVSMAVGYTPRAVLPLAEEFTSDGWQSSLTVAGGSAAAIDDAQAGDGRALEFGGGVTIETAPLAAMNSVGDALRFAVRTKHVGAGETLTAEYLDDQGQWITLFTAPSSGVDGGYIVQEESLPAGFAYHGAQIRLRTSDGPGTSDDRWIIDSFDIGPATPAPVRFADSFETGRLSPARWPASNNADPVPLGGDFAMAMGNDAFAQTAGVSLVDLSVFETWAHFQVAGEGVSGGDVLGVEYFTAATGWAPLAQIDASGLTTAREGVEIALPTFVFLADDFALRFTASTGGGTIYVDDVNIGDTRLPATNPGCSVADLAEPFGVLNFFDISAYLSAFNAGDPSADLADPIGAINFFDLNAYLSAFNAGCP